jgi:hypothetical protein
VDYYSLYMYDPIMLNKLTRPLRLLVWRKALVLPLNSAVESLTASRVRTLTLASKVSNYALLELSVSPHQPLPGGDIRGMLNKGWSSPNKC